MPSNWTKGSKKKEEAWQKAKKSFKKSKGHEPKSDDDYKYVMGVAKKIYKNMTENWHEKVDFYLGN